MVGAKILAPTLCLEVILSLVYFAHPIDRVEGGLTPAVSAVRRALGRVFQVSYCPGFAFDVNPGFGEPTSQVRDINMAALDASDVLVVLWEGGQASWGVPAEVERAISKGIPVHIFSDCVPTWSQVYSEVGVETYRVPSEWFINTSALTCYVEEVLSEWVSSVGVTRVEVDAVAPRQRDYLPMPYVLLNGNASAPSRAYEDDAGLDIYVSEDVVVAPGEYVDVPCGLAVQLPEGTWGLLVGRSSALRKRGLLVNLGVIDVGYRGQLFTNVLNVTDEEVQVKKGERLSQLIVLPNLNERTLLGRVDVLDEHRRGSSGFGSSGE